MSQFEYINSINKVIEKVDSVEVASAIKEAAQACAEAIGSGKLVHMFGSKPISITVATSPPEIFLSSRFKPASSALAV